MKQYVKKPIPVSALQWTGDNLEEMKAFCEFAKIDFSYLK